MSRFARTARLREGTACTDIDPSGIGGEPGSGRLQIAGEEVAAIRLVFEFRAEGLTLAQIADRLTQAGHVTKSGSQFTHVQVYRILAREDFYCGVSVFTKSISSDSVCHEAAL